MLRIIEITEVIGDIINKEFNPIRAFSEGDRDIKIEEITYRDNRILST